MKSHHFHEAGRSSLERLRGPASRPVILVAEDHDDSRHMMRTLLETKGYAIEEARDGKQAIAVALSKCPSLILLDVRLRDLDGIAVTRHLRERTPTQYVPIVIVSGCDPATHEKLAFAAGCNEYLLKPIDFDRLDAILDRYAPCRSPTNASTPRQKKARQNS